MENKTKRKSKVVSETMRELEKERKVIGKRCSALFQTLNYDMQELSDLVKDAYEFGIRVGREKAKTKKAI